MVEGKKERSAKLPSSNRLSVLKSFIVSFVGLFAFYSISISVLSRTDANFHMVIYPANCHLMKPNDLSKIPRLALISLLQEGK